MHATNFSACWLISAEFDRKVDISNKTQFPQSLWRQTARLRWGIFSRLLQTGSVSYLFLYVKSCCMTVCCWMRESQIGRVLTYIYNLTTGKSSAEAFTSVDSEVKCLEVTNPLGCICPWTCETSCVTHYFNSLYSSSKQGLEIFTAISWSVNCDLIAAPKEICLLGINFAAENNSRLEDEGNFCQIMISESFL